MDLALTGLVPTNTAMGVYLTSPAHDARFSSPAAIGLSAYATVGGSPVSRVEYYSGAIKVGESVNHPFNVLWNDAPVGTHVLTAKAIYGAEEQMTSPPVTITVGNPPPSIVPVSQNLITAGSAWRYWDSATPVAGGWQWPDFDDRAWPTGFGRFGWGLDGENTTLTDGRVTHYLRRWFAVADATLLTELVFGIVRDDGAVVYLNGREVFRSNMPNGPLAPNTLAAATVNTPEETMWFERVLATAGSGLTSGSNLVAVELHQSSATSSDAGLDLHLTGHGTTEPRVYLSSPLQHQIVVVPAEVELIAQARSGAGTSVARVDFFADGTNLGAATAAPWRVTWNNPPLGTHVLTAVATDSSGHWMSSEPVNIDVGNQPVALTLIPSGAVWKYLDNGSNQGTNWAQVGYSDATWASGPAELGYGDASDSRPEATVVGYGPNANNKYPTTYFRHRFTVPANVVITNLEYRLLRDDGAVVWLNGREQFRSNMPGGAIGHTTYASGTVDGAAEATYHSTVMPTSSVLPGTNLVAVEIHQRAGTSSDISFDLELTGQGYLDAPAPPRLTAEPMGGFTRLSWPADAPGWVLESTVGLPPSGIWLPYDASVFESNGRKYVLVPASLNSQFFRLAHP
jgi:hypothetical protein